MRIFAFTNRNIQKEERQVSKLLISSQPLMESEKALKVSPVLAMEIGLNEAIFLEQTHFLLDKQSECHFVDGHYWGRSSLDGWNKQFPFWSPKTIGRVIAGLEKSGLSGFYNSERFDRTKWYRVNYELVETMGLSFSSREQVNKNVDRSVIGD